MANASSPSAVLDEIAALPRGDDLARLVHTVAFAAADERRTALGDGLAEVAERAGIKPEDAETKHGNVLRALERGGAEAAGSQARTLLAALLARGVALSPPVGNDAEARVAEALLWLSTNTSVDALSVIDAALGHKADGLWTAVSALVRRIDEGAAPALGRAAALIGAAALRESPSDVAKLETEALAEEARDPVVKSLLTVSDGAPAPSDATGERTSAGGTVKGEIVGAPRGPVGLVLLGVTGLLAVMHAARLVGRLALGYRRPAELIVSPRGVVIKSRIELLGRTLREREAVIPAGSLLRASREIRYPRLGLYVGLFALALGSYFGAMYLVDGIRGGSPEYIGFAALLVAAGVGLDFLLENAGSGMRGKCRVVLEPRRGPATALGEIEPAVADRALTLLKRS